MMVRTETPQLDLRISGLSGEMDQRKSAGLRYDGVADALRRLQHKRENVAKHYDRVLVGQLLQHIESVSSKYTLYVSIGKLEGIRNRARRGNSNGRGYRKMIHRWSFARVTKALEHGLAQLGWSTKGKGARFQAVPESWTSIMCWKCGRRGNRPKQDLFVCPTCGNKCNADKNGSINIACRLITLTDSLHSVRGLGVWARAANRSRSSGLKAQGSKSRGKSLLSAKGSTSDPRESAAVHLIRKDRCGAGGAAPVAGDDDPAVARTVETLSAAGDDVPATMQENETRSEGGIASR